MAPDGLRGFIELLRQKGEILTVRREVSPWCEISALIKEAGGKAVFCERVKGFPIPVTGNIFGNYRKIELALEVPRERLLTTYLERIARPIPPKVVADGPVKEVRLLGEEVDLGRLPIPTVNEKDGGPYIDAGIIIVKDQELGSNLSLQRLQYQGPRQTGIFINPSAHLLTYLKRAEERQRPLEVAVAIGCDPVLYLASQVTGAASLDEYGIAGALKGRAIEVVKGETVDLEVPADAEIVLEGIIPPGIREPEGPFGEFLGYYGSVDRRPAPIIQYRAITHRQQPIFQMIYEGKSFTEGGFLTAIPKAADLYTMIQRVVPEVRDVYFTPGGNGRFHVVAAIKKRIEGEGKLALASILSSRIAVKHAVVVDDDIDIHNIHEVEWAVATRSQFDRDSLIITDAPGMLDPSMVSKRGRELLTKVGIDATRPVSVPFPEVCDVPPEILQRVEREWSSYL